MWILIWLLEEVLEKARGPSFPLIYVETPKQDEGPWGPLFLIKEHMVENLCQIREPKNIWLKWSDPLQHILHVLGSATPHCLLPYQRPIFNRETPVVAWFPYQMHLRPCCCLMTSFPNRSSIKLSVFFFVLISLDASLWALVLELLVYVEIHWWYVHRSPFDKVTKDVVPELGHGAVYAAPASLPLCSHRS